MLTLSLKSSQIRTFQKNPLQTATSVILIAKISNLSKVFGKCFAFFSRSTKTITVIKQHKAQGNHNYKNKSKDPQILTHLPGKDSCSLATSGTKSCRNSVLNFAQTSFFPLLQRRYLLAQNNQQHWLFLRQKLVILDKPMKVKMKIQHFF